MFWTIWSILYHRELSNLISDMIEILYDLSIPNGSWEVALLRNALFEATCWGTIANCSRALAKAIAIVTTNQMQRHFTSLVPSNDDSRSPPGLTIENRTFFEFPFLTLQLSRYFKESVVMEVKDDKYIFLELNGEVYFKSMTFIM